MPETWVAGADGGRKGAWIVAEGRLRRDRLEEVSTRLEGAFAGVLSGPKAESLAVVALDTPMGLPEQTERGGRAADRAARRRLGSRSSTVFSAPCRVALEAGRKRGFEATFYAEVAQKTRAASPDGLALSRQAFFLLPRVEEVDRTLRGQIGSTKIVEVHPELSFLKLNEDAALPPKKTFGGKVLRLRALEAAGINALPGLLALENDPRANADDILDAYACLWSAARVARGEAECLPEGEPNDRFGIPMVIHV